MMAARPIAAPMPMSLPSRDRALGGRHRARHVEAGDGGEVLRHVGAEDLAGADEAEAHVAELERVARLEDAALQLDAVDADAVGARLVDDLEAAVAEREELGVHAAHRAVVDGDRRLLRAADGEVLLVERVLGAGLRADDDDEAVRPLVDGRAAGGGAAPGVAAAQQPLVERARGGSRRAARRRRC